MNKAFAVWAVSAALLQKKKEEACLQKEDELKTALENETESLFGTAAEYLTKALSAFEQGGGQK